MKLELIQKINLNDLDKAIEKMASLEDLNIVKSQLGNFDLNK